jgi:hypothetical protein
MNGNRAKTDTTGIEPHPNTRTKGAKPKHTTWKARRPRTQVEERNAMIAMRGTDAGRCDVDEEADYPIAQREPQPRAVTLHNPSSPPSRAAAPTYTAQTRAATLHNLDYRNPSCKESSACRPRPSRQVRGRHPDMHAKASQSCNCPI